MRTIIICFFALLCLPASAKEIVFQQGSDITIDGIPTGIIYLDTQDAEIQSAQPNVNFDGGSGGSGGVGGGNSELKMDGDNPVPNEQSQVLLKFGGIFGGANGQIPPRSTIHRAVLCLSIDNSGDRLRLYEVGVPWIDQVVTWDTFGAGSIGIAEPNAEFLLDLNASVPGGVRTKIDVTAQLAAWSRNPSGNEGWGLVPSGPNGVDVDSSHNTDPSDAGDRPTLLVDFSPPPASLTLVEPIPPGPAPVAIPGLRLTVDGYPEQLYRIDESTDLFTWTELTTFQSPTGMHIIDDPGPSLQRRFFRAFEMPQLPDLEVTGARALVLRGGFPPNALVEFDLDNNGSFDFGLEADADGFLTIPLDLGGLPSPQTVAYRFTDPDTGSPSATASFEVAHAGVPVSSLAVPASTMPGAITPIDQPSICACEVCCPPCLDMFNGSFTPTEHGVELANGRMRKSIPITKFNTRVLNFDLTLHHATHTQYDGPYGCSMSHSFNMMIIQDTPNQGRIITPNMRIFQINSPNGTDWDLPEGFFSRLTLNPNTARWNLTHFTGVSFEFFAANPGEPGLPIAVREPNGNTMRLGYNADGYLTSVTTPLGQVQELTYSNGLLATFTNHLGHLWTFNYSPNQNLQQVGMPTATTVQVFPGQLLDDANLGRQLNDASRQLSFQYGDFNFPWHMTQVQDARGAVQSQVQYDPDGRVQAQFINGAPEIYQYRIEVSPPPGLPPLQPLDPNNFVTRVIDRDGNITDHEMHATVGAPIGDLGKGGIRRKVTFTESAKGAPALRPGEPDFYEQRFLQDCDCLRPGVVGSPFSDADLGSLSFGPDQIATNWPRHAYTYNPNRQILVDDFTDGSESIRIENTYQVGSFGDGGQFSRVLTTTDPREFDTNPIYAGLSFVHSYTYDDRGNMIRHDSPTVTRGVAGSQAISESWTYNEFGQVEAHTNPNGNITAYLYHVGPSSGGDINTIGSFGGYLAATIRGTTGSADGNLSLVTAFDVNSLGMETRRIDPNGFVYETGYNDLGEKVIAVEPAITSIGATYTTQFFYDGAGNRILERRDNLDETGAVSPTNPLVDRAYAYDDIGNLVAESREASETDLLVTDYAYDPNDRLIVEVKPEGNRTFVVYDERDLILRRFYGVDPGGFPTDGYPASDDATTLGIPFVGVSRYDYDGRRNRILLNDGRGNDTHYLYDSFDRVVATSDPNGNGSVLEYDDANNQLLEAQGVVSTSGVIAADITRVYSRYDEVGRKYQEVIDLIPSLSDERLLVDPGPGNSSYTGLFDAGSRMVGRTDAVGNTTTHLYDSADRMTRDTDALGNTRNYTYDPNSNLTRIERVEFPEAGLTGVGDPVSETYVTEFVFDELNRQTEIHDRGHGGTSIDHETTMTYDSRNNLIRRTDGEGNAMRYTYDDADRVVTEEKLDSGSVVIELEERDYDGNSRVVELRTYSDTSDVLTMQPTRYTYDSLDRLELKILPDSDDTIAGGDGVDGTYDRIEYTYDANSNLVTKRDQREVVCTYTYDAANRRTVEVIGLPAGVPGHDRCEYVYDELDRLTVVRNNYSQVTRVYDALSRIISEEQAIRLDGTGFTNGYEFPYGATRNYDPHSNQTRLQVISISPLSQELRVDYTYDGLNRCATVSAEYFGEPLQSICEYDYYGPLRLAKKRYANGADLVNSFDPKGRIAAHQWSGTSNDLLGFGYLYDDVDNVTRERFTHDGGRYDHYDYNARYEIVDAELRSTSAVPGAATSTYTYDDIYNRVSSVSTNGFALAPVTDSYLANPANEYTAITRIPTAVSAPVHDRAGNATGFPVLPVTAVPVQTDVDAVARYDAANRLFDLDTPATANPVQHYRYDGLGRRIAVLEGAFSSEVPVRRYIYDEWEVAHERTFTGAATLASAPSIPERIHVNGRQLDEHILSAIDGNGDGSLGGGNPKNVPATAGSDQEFYYLCNRLGSVMGLSNADNDNHVLEYYRYSVFGEPVAVLGTGAVDTADQDLSNNLLAGSTRVSQHGNSYLFTGRRWDEKTGLYYNRHRYYEPRQGRFISRDPLGEQGEANLFAYAGNNAATRVDPLGQKSYVKNAKNPCCYIWGRVWNANGHRNMRECIASCVGIRNSLKFRALVAIIGQIGCRAGRLAACTKLGSPPGSPGWTACSRSFSVACGAAIMAGQAGANYLGCRNHCKGFQCIEWGPQKLYQRSRWSLGHLCGYTNYWACPPYSYTEVPQR